MSYLTRLPIDVIKIDQSFVRNIDQIETLKKIVKSIITLSEGLGIKNVFEGVEREGELSVIQSMNGEIVQGYYYCKPLGELEINEWLKNNKNLTRLQNNRAIQTTKSK